MADQLDDAAQLEAQDRQGGIEAAREAMRGEGAAYCDECGEPLPLARREAVPSARLCIDCADPRAARR